MTPQRIQLKRTKGFRLQETSMALNGLSAVKVDRSTRWGNPWVVFHPIVHRPNYWVSSDKSGVELDTYEEALALCLRKFRYHATTGMPDVVALRGKNIACWCPLPHPGEPDHCHGAVLLEIANQETVR